MASGKLTARKVDTAKPGRHGDGAGLWLRVSKSGAKTWVYRFTIAGKVSEAGLGPYPAVTLIKARQLAAEATRLSREGLSPVKAKREAQAEAIKAIKPAFSKIADDLIAAKASQWRNHKHKAQWEMTLKTYCKPIWTKPVDEIQTADILSILKPLWKRVPETASRLRGRIEAVLDAAKAQGYRAGENPASWRGHLAHLLPKRQKLTRGHHAAMAYADIPAFIALIRAIELLPAKALEFTILTATRTNEALGARWAEIDMKAKVWEIPATRMKAGVAYRVPLSSRAVEILETLEVQKTNDFVFPGRSRNKSLSNMSMLMLVRRMEVSGITVHGFRSALRDWAGNETSFPRDVCEAALAHTIQGVEAAYRRSDALDKRRALMEAWAQYCEPSNADNVLKFHKSGVKDIA